jgi:amidophosphoribosyltransferase
MCGIVAILLADPSAAVNQEIYDALTSLQHRGQDAAGIVTSDQRKRLHLHKDSGLVRDVFKLQHMINLIGNVGLGHVRYGAESCLGTRITGGSH